MKISKELLIKLPVIADPRGNLTFIEGPCGQEHVPFEIRRVYYLYDVPGGAERGGHAHKKLQQMIIAISGSFDVRLTDGIHSECYSLNRSYNGLIVPPLTWREINNFSSGAVCLVLASDIYDEADYFRNFETFLEHIRKLP